MSAETRLMNFHITDSGIFVFEFKALERNSATTFSKIVRDGNNQFPQQLRILYDYSQSDPPTPYFLHISAKLTAQTQFPEDTKSAYVIGSMEKEIWVHILQRYQPTDHPVRTFMKQEQATRWLLAD